MRLMPGLENGSFGENCRSLPHRFGLRSLVLRCRTAGSHILFGQEHSRLETPMIVVADTVGRGLVHGGLLRDDTCRENHARGAPAGRGCRGLCLHATRRDAGDSRDVVGRVDYTLDTLQGRCRMVMATKGDLLDRRRKLERSGVAHYFDHAEIMSDKNEAAYTALTTALGVPPERFLMVGNSLRSDIYPVLAAAGRPCIYLSR